MKKNVLLILTSLVSFHLAAMEPLSDSAMQQVEGQAGADLSLKLVLNQTNTNDSYLSAGTAYQFDNGTGGACANLSFCHLALSVNNRYINATTGLADSTGGYKLWVVFKGIQGTINIQKLGLDGTDLVYTNKAGLDMIKPAIQLSFNATMPIQIRNFGYNAMSIEQDKFTSSTNATTGIVTENSTSNVGDYAYLKNTTYTTANSVYDSGRETGFMGMKMNGNLVLQGNVMMFSCNGNTARC